MNWSTTKAKAVQAPPSSQPGLGMILCERCSMFVSEDKPRCTSITHCNDFRPMRQIGDFR